MKPESEQESKKLKNSKFLRAKEVNVKTVLCSPPAGK